MKKFREYVDRYGKSELWASGAVFLFAFIIYRRGGGMLQAVASATIVDPLAFYTVAFIRNRRHERLWLNGVKRLAMEHVGAGMFNALVVRPLLLAFFIGRLGIFWGTVTGKFAADAVFYCVSMPMHELSKRLIPRKESFADHEEDA